MHTMKEWFQSLILNRLEKIEPFCIPPWLPGAEVDIEPRDEALEKALKASEASDIFTSIFTDGSTKKNGSGIGTAFGDGQPLFCKVIERVHHHRAELAAVRRVVKFVERIVTRTFHQARTYNIYSDSQSVLRILENPRQQDGQGTVRRTMEAIWAIKREGHRIRFHWVPGHSGVPGNETAHKLAEKATTRPILPSSARILCRADFPRDQRESEKLWRGSLYIVITGQFTKEIDKAIPQKYTKALYSYLSREDAAILTQLRTSKCRLNYYLAKINASPIDLCEYGEPETVRHFLIKCPRWDTERQALKQAADKRWADLSYFLGGWNNTKHPNGTYINGPREKWKPDRKVVEAAISFAKNTETLRFRNIGRLSQDSPFPPRVQQASGLT
ncbi:hypothetical protein MKZ38_000562 [Zalerion maritima]|uniref:ribonuclease H n=1 Tax=Zalerion maritima TaxID=339359 RepID=A0AAD5WMN7_9PEZI|nr:hypothetical protein MKZ38_000562 [Zalerion maritima]